VFEIVSDVRSNFERQRRNVASVTPIGVLIIQRLYIPLRDAKNDRVNRHGRHAQYSAGVISIRHYIRTGPRAFECVTDTADSLVIIRSSQWRDLNFRGEGLIFNKSDDPNETAYVKNFNKLFVFNERTI